MKPLGVVGMSGNARLGEVTATGCGRGHIKTADGVVDFTLPQVTGTPGPFASKVKQNLPDRTGELGRMAIEMYARGLSMRDIEAAFTDESGRCALSKSVASQVAVFDFEDGMQLLRRGMP